MDFPLIDLGRIWTHFFQIIRTIPCLGIHDLRHAFFPFFPFFLSRSAQTSYQISPHIDARHKYFARILYLIWTSLSCLCNDVYQHGDCLSCLATPMIITRKTHPRYHQLFHYRRIYVYRFYYRSIQFLRYRILWKIPVHLWRFEQCFQ